jgi:hypothetical protein
MCSILPLFLFFSFVVGLAFELRASGTLSALSLDPDLQLIFSFLVFWRWGWSYKLFAQAGLKPQSSQSQSLK